VTVSKLPPKPNSVRFWRQRCEAVEIRLTEAVLKVEEYARELEGAEAREAELRAQLAGVRGELAGIRFQRDELVK
jgi:hypothetical protein